MSEIHDGFGSTELRSNAAPPVNIHAALQKQLYSIRNG